LREVQYTIAHFGAETQVAGGAIVRSTPEETFAEARSAMEHGDWDGFFACLVQDNLIRIAENSVGLFLNSSGSAAGIFDKLCHDNGIPKEKIDALRGCAEHIVRSAAESRAAATNPATMLEHSRRHQQIVAQYQNSLKETIKATPNLSSFVAAMERTFRAESGGGSVSSKLLVDEILDDVSVDGSKAWGKRRTSAGPAEDIGFVKKKGQWYVHLFAKPRK